MPELPEITVYIDALRKRMLDQPIERVRIASPSLLRTFDPPVQALEGSIVRDIRRMGKRLVWRCGDDLFAVVHLMLTGRFQWKPRGAAIPRKLGHAAFDLPTGTLLLTEAGPKKRASLHVLRGEAAVAELDRGGLEPLEADLAAFTEALRAENRTLKRALTDPRRFSGIGNAHSDEILLIARLSPARLTRQLVDDEVARLYTTVQSSLREWIDILRAETGDGFPAQVTAFHPRMAVHGKFGQPCPQCDSPIQRIVYAGHETNYCARCQTGGRLLADRAFSRLLGEDWPRTLED